MRPPDSISQYTFTVLHDTLQSVDKALVKKNKINDFHYTLTLDPSHARIPELLVTSGVSRSRLRFPLASFYRSDHLVTASQIPEVMGEATWDRLKVKVQRDAPDWWVLWVKLLEDAHGVLPAPADDDDDNLSVNATSSEDEPDLLVLNSGAHWNVGTLGYCEEEEFVAGYRKMVSYDRDRTGLRGVMVLNQAALYLVAKLLFFMSFHFRLWLRLSACAVHRPVQIDHPASIPRRFVLAIIGARPCRLSRPGDLYVFFRRDLDESRSGRDAYRYIHTGGRVAVDSLNRALIDTLYL